MHEVKEFCKSKDVDRPDFLKLAIKLGRISASRGEPGCKLSDREMEIVLTTENEYYKDHWEESMKKILRF
jgi:hypothetical protein